MTAEMTATYVIAVLGCMTRRAVRWLAEVILWVLDFALISFLGLGIWLGLHSTAAAEAQTDLQWYPAAVVDVNEGSWLNLRKEPAGEICGRVSCYTDLLLLYMEDEWVLVTTKRDLEFGWDPLGWVHMDYLRIYGDYLTDKKSPWAQPRAGTSPNQNDHNNYITTAEGLQ